MSKRVEKGPVERIRELSGVAKETLEAKMVALETEVQEQKKTLILGAIIFTIGVALGVAVANKEKK
jgi:hypothetical protein